MTEVSGQRSEVGGQDGRRRTEDGGRKTEDAKQEKLYLYPLRLCVFAVNFPNVKVIQCNSACNDLSATKGKAGT
jgi:hypothetical protein